MTQMKEGFSNFEPNDGNPNFRVHYEPPPSKLTFPRLRAELKGTEVNAPLKPAALRVDIHRKFPFEGLNVDEPEKKRTDERTDVYTIIPNNGIPISPLTRLDFSGDRDEAAERYTKNTSRMRSAALKRHVPQLFELKRVPYTKIDEVVSFQEGKVIVEINGLGWMEPGFAMEPIESAVQRFATETGFTQNVLSLQARIDHSIFQEGSNILGPDLPSQQLHELPLKSALKMIDLARLQERRKNGPNDSEVCLTSFTSQSLELRNRLLSAAKTYVPELTDKLEGIPTLSELFNELPPIIQMCAELSQIKLAAADRIIELAKHLPLPMFLDNYVIRNPKFKKTFVDLQNFIDDGAKDGLPDYSDPASLARMLRIGLTSYPLPEAMGILNGVFGDDYLEFQQKVQDESLKMAGIAA